MKLLNKKKKTEFLPRKFHWRHLSSTSVSVFYLLFSFFCFQFWITAENIIIYSVQYETDTIKHINYNGIYFPQIMFYKFKQSPGRLKKIIVATVEGARWCLVSIASKVILYKCIFFYNFSLSCYIWRQRVCTKIYIAETARVT